MAIVKWVFWITFWVLVGAFFHYTLPQVDIVRVTDTYEKRIDFGENSIFWAQADVGTKSTSGAPTYVALKHYGWRNEFLTIFPNAISIRPVDGPDASKGIPFLNTIILTLFFAIVYAIWVRWRRFRRARIDPTLEALEDDFAEKSGRISRWIGTWRKKP